MTIVDYFPQSHFEHSLLSNSFFFFYFHFLFLFIIFNANNKNHPFLLFFPVSFLTFICPHYLLRLLVLNLLRYLLSLFLFLYCLLYHLPCFQSKPAMIILTGRFITQQMISAIPDFRVELFHVFRHLFLVLFEYLPDFLAFFQCLVMQKFTFLIHTHDVFFAIIWHLAIIYM